jgi:SAM-dependent methyltransferase
MLLVTRWQSRQTVHGYRRRVDAELEAAKERAWRDIAAIDEAHARGALGDAGWYAAMAALVVPAYLAAETAEAGSGHSGSPADWEYSRSIVAEAIPRADIFLDVGCANGLLMESLHRWTGVEPYGLEISPELADLARRRLPRWADRIFVGNAIEWSPSFRFAVVRTSLEYVPKPRRRELIGHLLDRVVSPGGRLVIGKFNEGIAHRALEADVSAWGFQIAGRAERPHRTEPTLAYRAFWIDAAPAS